MATKTKRFRNGFWIGLLTGVLLSCAVFYFLNPGETAPVTQDPSVLDEDLFHSTTIAFEDAILGEAQKEAKLIVMNQPIEYSTTITNDGLFNWEVFRKYQNITYHGNGEYTVDMTKITRSDITIDAEKKIVTIAIPHPELTTVDPNLDEAQLEDTQHGLLAFGELKLDQQAYKKLAEQVEQKMRNRLLESDVTSQADEFALTQVKALFAPIIQSVSNEYTLEIVFQD